MRRRIGAAVCCLLLLAQLVPPPQARAAGYLCFVAVGDSILPLSDSTMPFWRDGFLYVPASSFAGGARESLGIGQTANSEQVILYRVGRRGTLRFDAGSDLAYDGDGNSYYPGGVQRNGEMFIPASVVAEVFGLQYSVADAQFTVDGQRVHADLAWVRRPGSSLTPQVFANAASFTLASRYADYLREQEQTGAETPEPSTGVEIEGKRIYLCLEAGADTGAQLDALDRYGAQAAFFCTPDFLAEQGDLLRRMAASGQSIGILADGADPDRSVAEQLAAGNEALERATCGRTRLCRVENGDAADLQTARAAGYRCLEEDLDRSGSALAGSANASTLLQRVSSWRGDVSVWLGGAASAAGLRAFLSAAEHAEGQCLAWTETA